MKHHLRTFGVLVTIIPLLLAGHPSESRAQAGCFAEAYPVGVLAGSGNCDGLRAGQVLGLSRNPAHAAWGKRWSAGGGYRQLYGLAALSRIWGAARYRGHSGGLGITLTRLGQTDFYAETEMGLCFAIRVRPSLALGMGLKNLQLTYTAELPSYLGWSVGAGMICQPLTEVVATAAIAQAWSTDFIPGHRLPRRYHLSLAITFPEEIQLGASWEKRPPARALLGLGQRLVLTQNFSFYAALYFAPARYALGAECILQGQAIYYTYVSHPQLGGTHYVEFVVGR
jgi:hypothetical protein